MNTAFRINCFCSSFSSPASHSYLWPAAAQPYATTNTAEKIMDLLLTPVDNCVDSGDGPSLSSCGKCERMLSGTQSKLHKR